MLIAIKRVIGGGDMVVWGGKGVAGRLPYGGRGAMLISTGVATKSFSRLVIAILAVAVFGAISLHAANHESRLSRPSIAAQSAGHEAGISSIHARCAETTQCSLCTLFRADGEALEAVTGLGPERRRSTSLAPACVGRVDSAYDNSTNQIRAPPQNSGRS